LFSIALGWSLARSLPATKAQAKSSLTFILVEMLLHSDRFSRAAFNVAALVQRDHAARIKGSDISHAGINDTDEDGD
jgi:hypothetical protein